MFIISFSAKSQNKLGLLPSQEYTQTGGHTVGTEPLMTTRQKDKGKKHNTYPRGNEGRVETAGKDR